jgi:RNA polymerase sigma-70 factor (ECF subfamily)
LRDTDCPRNEDNEVPGEYFLIGTGSDEELLEAVARGASEAMGALYKRHGGLIYRFALRMSGQKWIAEEVTQEVFLAMMKQARNFDPRRGALSTWLCGMARNMVWKQMRDDKRFESMIDLDVEGEASPAEDSLHLVLDRKEAVALVRSGIEELPAAMKEVVVLCELEELSYEDAARILHLPIGTVRSRLHRSKERLAKILTERGKAKIKDQSG